MDPVSLGIAAASAASGLINAGDAKDEEDRRRRIEETRLGADQQRQARMEGTIGLVNQLYDSPGRQTEMQAYMDALRGYFGEQLGKQHKVAARKRKFEIARGGQTGGSQDYASQTNLGEEHNEAILQNEQRVREAGAGLRADNEASRAQIINLIRQGTGATDAIRRSQASFGSNAANAFAQQRSNTLGNLFQGTTELYKSMREGAERRRGFGYGPGRQDLYGRTVNG